MPQLEFVLPHFLGQLLVSVRLYILTITAVKCKIILGQPSSVMLVIVKLESQGH